MQSNLTRAAARLSQRSRFAFASKELLFGNDARNRMLEGCDQLANAVQVTLGPNGRNVLIDQGFGPVKITKDGVTVAKAIEFSDRFANMGASLVKSVASKTNDEAGDGTTTATVLARAIFREALKKVEIGVNLTEMKKGIDLAVERLVGELRKISIPVEDKSQIRNIATISANGDEQIGELLADLIEKVGKTGVITIGQSKTLKHEVEFVEGMKFDRGFISPYFINNQKGQRVEFERPLILISEHKITNFQQILKFVEAALQKKRPLLIIADDVESEPLTSLILNKVQNSISVAAVKAPSFGDNRKAILNDIAILSGATVISEEVGVTFEDSDESVLGTAGKVEITKEDTVILSGSGDKTALNERVNQIKEQINNTTSTYDKEKLQERLSKLSGGVGIFKVGGASEVEVGEIKDRVQDAICATKAAIEEGIVVGGGCALLYAGRVLDTLKGENSEQELGIKIIKKAITLPCKTISDNAGFEGITTIERITASNNTNFGFDASKGEFVDLIARGIVDPAKVVRVALEDAASVSSYMTTTECMIVEKKEEKPAGPPRRHGRDGRHGRHGRNGRHVLIESTIYPPLIRTYPRPLRRQVLERQHFSFTLDVSCLQKWENMMIIGNTLFVSFRITTKNAHPPPNSSTSAPDAESGVKCKTNGDHVIPVAPGQSCGYWLA